MQEPKPESRVLVKTDSASFEGIVLPSDGQKLILKLSNGYNVGIDKKKIKSVEVLPVNEPRLVKPSHVEPHPKLPTIQIIHTGGTIASKVDYRTGAVVSRSSPDEILASVPELASIANLEATTLFQMFSEDFEPIHWTKLAEKIDELLKKRPKGFIVAVGTDTLEYVASALSFALQGINVPVLLVGSQRSSDRPSSDSSLNLICASKFISETDFKGVAVCMHNKTDDTDCLITEANHVKKMHTSRRDTFRPINRRAVALVSPERIKYLRKDYRNDEGNYKLMSAFSPDVGLVMIYPTFKAEQLDWYEKNSKALVIEGYAFGQMPINESDVFTKHHPKLLAKVKELAKKMPVVMVSQRPYGVVHMNVYSTGRELLDAGVIEAKMQAHVAYVKLCFVLANHKDVRKAMIEDITGETVDRTESEAYLW